MDMKKALLAGISASALLIASSAVTFADDAVDDVRSNSDNNDQDIEIGSDNTARGGRGRFSSSSADGFDDHNAVAVAALQQSSVQIVASEDENAIDDDYDAEMDFGSDAFRDQTMNNNNFNSGVNALQGNAMAVAGTADNSFNTLPAPPTPTPVP